jgi:hypothetical protein
MAVFFFLSNNDCYSLAFPAINASSSSSADHQTLFNGCVCLPRPTVTWLKGIRDVVESGRSCVEMDGDSYRFILKKANYGDGGTYIVKASNCHGSQKAYCTVRVSYRVDHERLISRPQACHPLLYISFWAFVTGQGNGQLFRLGFQGLAGHAAARRFGRVSSQTIQQR